MYDISKLPDGIEKLFLDLENRIMSDVVRRIKKTGEITSTADMQLLKYAATGNSTREIQEELRKALVMSDEELNKIYADIVDKLYVQNESLYITLNKQFIPYESNYELQQMVNAIKLQTASEIKNITKSMGFLVDMGYGKKVFSPFSEYYQQILDKAVIDIATGSFDYNTVLRKTVKEMTASGIRTVRYESGFTNRITVATRRATMTGIRQLFSQMTEMNAAALGTEDFEVSAHVGARPDHQRWQGQVYSKQELVDVCGLGTGPGLCGWNCYHTYLPFVKGVSVRAYADEQLTKMAQRDNQTYEWDGKEMPRYELSQEQRKMETLMRKQRQDVVLLKKGWASWEDVQIAKTKYATTLHEYQSFCKRTKLKNQIQRVYMDGLGRIA